jgi:hypothetical protein
MTMGAGETGWEPVDCTDLTEYVDQWRSLGNTTMKLWLPQNERNLNERCSIIFSKRYAYVDGTWT